MRSILTGIAVSVLVVPLSVSAADDQGFYGSVGGGAYRLEVDDFKDIAPTINLLGGYDFNRYFAVEGAYRHLLEAKDRTQGVSLDIDGDVWEVSAKAAYPLADRIKAFGRLGWSYYKFSGEADFLGATLSADEEDNDLTWALGASYDLTDRLNLRGEFAQILINDGDADFVSFNLAYNF